MAGEPVFAATELLDLERLKVLYTRWDELPFPQQCREQRTGLDGKPYDPRKLLCKILNRMTRDNGELHVKYKYSTLMEKLGGGGRKFAVHAESLQSLACPIRHTLAGDLYHDIDIVNCHPTILVQYCERKGIQCAETKNYVRNRDQLFAESGLTKDQVKKEFLTAMYSDHVGFHQLQWMTDIDVEIKLMAMPEHKKLLDATRKKAKGNTAGSLLSSIMCEIEDDILMACVDFLKSKNISISNIVLMFDGFMLRKTALPTPHSCLQEMTDYVQQTTGYSVDFAVKPMNQGIDLTGFRPKFAFGQCATDDAHASSILAEYIGNRCIKSNGVIYVKNRRGVWVSSPRQVDEELLRMCAEADITRMDDKTGDVKPYSKYTTHAHSIIRMYKAIVPEYPDWVSSKLWVHSLGKIFYEDGCWDFREGAFRTFHQERDTDMTTIRLGRKFPARDGNKMNRALDLLISIFGDEQVVRNILRHVARGLAGEGERNCGKGVFTLANRAAFGEYVIELISDNFLMERNRMGGGDEAKKCSWLLDCWWKRLAFTNEITVDSKNPHVKINGNLIKGKLTSGTDTVQARKNYQDEVQFIVQCRLFMCANDYPPITPTDTCNADVFSKFQFPYRFVTKDTLEATTDAGMARVASYPMPFWRPADDSIKSKVMSDDFIDGYTWLVLDSYKPNKVVNCEKVRRWSESFAIDEGDEDTIIGQIFTVTGNKTDQVLSDDIKELLKHMDTNMSLQKIKAKLERMGCTHDENCRVNGRRGRGFYGVVLKKAPDSDY